MFLGNRDIASLCALASMACVLWLRMSVIVCVRFAGGAAGEEGNISNAHNLDLLCAILLLVSRISLRIHQDRIPALNACGWWWCTKL